jgi:hypothetical protein
LPNRINHTLPKIYRKRTSHACRPPHQHAASITSQDRGQCLPTQSVRKML